MISLRDYITPRTWIWIDGLQNVFSKKFLAHGVETQWFVWLRAPIIIQKFSFVFVFSCHITVGTCASEQKNNFRQYWPEFQHYYFLTFNNRTAKAMNLWFCLPLECTACLLPLLSSACSLDIGKNRGNRTDAHTVKHLAVYCICLLSD